MDCSPHHTPWTRPRCLNIPSTLASFIAALGSLVSHSISSICTKYIALWILLTYPVSKMSLPKTSTLDGHIPSISSLMQPFRCHGWGVWLQTGSHWIHPLWVILLVAVGPIAGWVEGWWAIAAVEIGRELVEADTPWLLLSLREKSVKKTGGRWNGVRP